MGRRRGLTLAETVVVLSISAALVAYLLPLAVKAREALVRLRCGNRQRELSFAIHHYAGNYDGKLPYYGKGRPSPHSAVVPYLDGGRLYLDYLSGPMDRPFYVPQYHCPGDSSDPSEPDNPWAGGQTSYAVNWQVFRSETAFGTSFPDGLATTLAVAEHYGVCDGTSFLPLLTRDVGPFFERSTFAGPNSVAPKTRGEPPVSLADNVKRPRTTFQVRPKLADCAASVAQTPHPAGMTVSMLDGSVRRFRGDIDPAVYWGATTPDKGETIKFE